MKERELPLRDIKTAIRIVGKTVESIGEGVRPYAQEYVRKRTTQVMKKVKLL